jgi:hypothetical protein
VKCEDTTETSAIIIRTGVFKIVGYKLTLMAFDRNRRLSF